MRCPPEPPARIVPGMAHITIDDLDPIVSYTVSTARFVFPVPFAYFETSNLVVTVGDATLTLGTDYSVAGTAVDDGFSSGTVTLDTAVTNTTVVIERILPVERVTDFPYSGPLSIRALNTQLDRFVAFLQQVVAQVAALSQRVTDFTALFSTLINSDTTVTLFDTLGAYRLATIGAGVTYIRTAGRDDVGDGGHGLYKIISTPSPAQPWHEVSANSKYIELIPEGNTVRGQQLGVFGDGGEYSAEWQDAVDFVAQASRSLTLELPAGNFTANPANLPITAAYAFNMVGSGAAQRGLGAAEVGGTKIYVNSDTVTVLQVRTRNSCMFKDFTIQRPNTSTAGASIDLAPDDPAGVNANVGSRFENLHFIGGFYHIKLTECVGYNIHDCSLWNAGTGGAAIANFNNAAAPDSGDCVIENNQFWDFNITDANAAILIQAGSGLIITKNKILGHNRAIAIRVINGTSGVIQIVDNNIEAQNHQCIFVEQAVNGSFWGQITIADNHFQADVDQVVLITQGVTANYINYVLIANNRINLGTPTAPGSAAITILDGYLVLCTGNMMEANNTARIGFSVGGFATRVKLVENVCDMFASGVYDALSTATQVIDHVNGLTVASLGSWANGSMVYTSDGVVNSVPLTGSSTGSTARRIAGAWRGD